MVINFIGATCIFMYLGLIWLVLRDVLQEVTPFAQVKPLLILGSSALARVVLSFQPRYRARH